jgi:hypothetical protein
MVGAICFGESHCSQEDSQKRVVMPSPRVMVVVVAKRRRSSSLHGMGIVGVTRKIRMTTQTRERVLNTFKYKVRVQRDCDSPCK